jgi:hypothetical protein
VKVVQLHTPYPAQDVVQTLRRIADDIEKGEHGIVTTAAVCIGHTEERPAGNEREMRNDFTLFGMGPRADVFTIRGLLLTCATRV